MTRLLKTIIPVILCALFGLSFASPAQAAASLPIVLPALTCDALSATDFSAAVGAKVTINHTEMQTSAQGSWCKVSATIAPQIGVQIALPTQRWSQRFLQVGCGGLCGSINLSLSNASGCLPAMNGEFVVAATDMGHHGSMMDASWAEDPQKRIDFAWRANHLTAVLAKAVMQTLYRQPPKYAYFMGCSDGGREALMEAQRFPQDFDGISAGAPAAFFQFQNSFFHGWNVAANQRPDGTAILLKDRLPLIHQAVLAHCPTLSGVQDGILQNPYACQFSETWLPRCPADAQNRSACLTQEEIEVVKKLYRGAYDSHGAQFVAGGLPLGSELRWPVPETPTGHSMSEMMVLPALQSVLLPGGKQKIQSMRDFPLNQQNFDAVAQLAPLYNAANTNLHAYQQRGGKLILWHGLADDSVSPAFSIAYYRGVEAEMGHAATDTFLRLFLLPGVAHCGNGEGYDQIDLLTPLMRWTEEGIAPQEIMAGKRAPAAADLPPMTEKPDAQTQFHGVQKVSQPFADAAPAVIATRPAYPFPAIARYNGHGDVNDGENYHAEQSTAFGHLQLAKPASDYIGPDNQKNYQVRHGELTVQ
ncbi:Mono(2-hydroxyethyl) terephthalate hydrolase [Klebsiella quasivariicola]|uniref:tannase/feruloyl esterase family alpha/beta hydrolase n=1 Tax=Klebsiella TaxID=570 RepID=UPI00109C8FCE|nr:MULTISPECIES: tannase/feruloyl esterase family alpha/beta hydrolase [Klebsiella]MBS5210383.1 tannase/feruloyl esterase family alpha/beta hydrolase [Klebsiella sp.]MDF2006712.1 tannase/feruloyl esterase family alpha/beta hydrolase [Klebsiella quasivariicola]MDK6608655.1 tannase/feruloyl esterase family alpha/beta hydrolase [Klebsiella quasivariicola]MDK7209049.1 tannase/feruloyl esterase family alpha/beta hydrolase [Klebsiella quasivariicola]VGQ14228.1 Mono(2-hydroxyethyl) terephthalate hydr